MINIASSIFQVATGCWKQMLSFFTKQKQNDKQNSKLNSSIHTKINYNNILLYHIYYFSGNLDPEKAVRSLEKIFLLPREWNFFSFQKIFAETLSLCNPTKQKAPQEEQQRKDPDKTQISTFQDSGFSPPQRSMFVF